MKKNLIAILLIVLTGVFGGCLSKTNDVSTDNGTTTTKVGSITGVAKYKNQSDFSNILITVEKLSSGAVTQSVKRAVSLKRSVGIVAYKTTTTDKNGNYKLTGLEEGTYTIYASNQDSTEKAVKTNIEVKANIETTATILQLTPTGNISGKIIVNSKETGNLGYLVCVAGTSYLSVTDDGGNFKIDNIPVGTGYALLVLKGNETKNVKFVDVTQGNTTSAGSVQITTTEIVSNTILSDFGVPVDTKGINGDLYFNFDNGDVYKKADNKWSKVTNIKGQNGTTGSSIVWKGTLTTAPSNPELNWAYYNSNDKKSYIYIGASWVILAQDGLDGEGTSTSGGITAIMPEIIWEANIIDSSYATKTNYSNDKTKIYAINTKNNLITYNADTGVTLGSNQITGSSVSISSWAVNATSGSIVYIANYSVYSYDLLQKSNSLLFSIKDLATSAGITLSFDGYSDSYKFNSLGSIILVNSNYIINIEKKTIKKLPSDFGGYQLMNEEDLIAINLGKMYKIDINTYAAKEVLKIACYYNSIYNNTLLALNADGGVLNVVDLINTSKIKVINLPYTNLYTMNVVNDKIVLLSNGYAIFEVDYTTGEIIKKIQGNSFYSIVLNKNKDGILVNIQGTSIKMIKL